MISAAPTPSPIVSDPEDTLFTLSFRVDSTFIRPLTELVEAQSMKAGLGQARARQFMLATEELLSYLAGVLDNQQIQACLTPSATGLILQLRFPEDSTPLHHFNFATNRDQYLHDEDAAEALGLYIAARMVSDVHIAVEEQSVFLSLAQDKPYPEIPPFAPAKHLNAPYKLIETPDHDTLELACAHTLATVQSEHRLELISQPERFSALIRAGLADAVIVTDSSGQIAGWLGWSQPNSRTARFFGPYLFNVNEHDQHPLAVTLCEAMLSKIGKTRVHSVFAGTITTATPAELFEQIQIPGRAEQPQFYRQLREETGSVVRCPAFLRSELASVYDALFLIRQIVPAPDPAQLTAQLSVFNVKLSTDQQSAQIQLLLAGQDFVAAMRTHLCFLQQHGITEVLAHCDLHDGWQATCAGLLLDMDFNWYALEPEAGKGDVIILQYRTD